MTPTDPPSPATRIAMPHDRPFLILQTGRPVPSMRRHGGFAHWIRVAAGLGRDEVAVVDAQAGEALPPAWGYAGVLVTGSGAMVSDREGWSERAAGWLGEAVQRGVPVFGICYGHQLLAHALGGEVGDNPRGRRMGTVEVRALPAAAADPLFAAAPARFAAQVTHLQTVQRAPDGAVLLAAADHDGHHAFRWGRHAWGVQFHPEFSAGHMRGYIGARAQALRHEGTDPRALAAQVRAAPQARRLLRRFARYARTLSPETGSGRDAIEERV